MEYFTAFFIMLENKLFLKNPCFLKSQKKDVLFLDSNRILAYLFWPEQW